MKRRRNPEPRWLTELIRRMDGNRREERDKAGLPEWQRADWQRAKHGNQTATRLSLQSNSLPF
jgi:hypothetical protein